MKKIRLLLLALCAIAFAACSFLKSDSPSSVVKEYLDCIKSGDYKQAVKCFHFKEEVEEAELDALAEKLEQGYGKDGKLVKYEIVSEEIEKDDAGNAVRGKVVAKLFYEGDKEDESTIPTIKVDGKWKIDLSK